MTALHLSRLSEDLILWNFRVWVCFVADTFTTGSSLMPQKKNPDCYELVRGKTGRIVGNLTNLLIAVKGLPLTYNDLQEDKPPVFDSFDQLSVCLAVVKGCMEGTLSMRKSANLQPPILCFLLQIWLITWSLKVYL